MTPRQAMKQMWDEMESGEIKPTRLIILYHHEPEPDADRVIPGHWCSDMGTPEFIGMTEVAKVLAIRTYLGEDDGT